MNKKMFIVSFIFFSGFLTEVQTKPCTPTFPHHFPKSRGIQNNLIAQPLSLLHSTFIERNKVKIIIGALTIGAGIGYYAATRGLSSTTIIKDLKNVKNFCTKNTALFGSKSATLLTNTKQKTKGFLTLSKNALNSIALKASTYALNIYNKIVTNN